MTARQPTTVTSDPLFDAKGDLVVATGPDTAVRFPAGADGTYLGYDSSTSTGLTAATPAGGGGGTPGPSIQEWTLASSTSVGGQTITLDHSPSRADIYRGWFVVDPWSTSCEIKKASSVAGNVVTLANNASVTSSSVVFDGPTKTIKITNNTTMRKFFPQGGGQTKIIVTGSTGGANDGTFTVLSVNSGTTSTGYDTLTVAESVVTQPIGPSVTIRSSLNFAHASGTPVLFTASDDAYVVWYGWKASSATGDATQNTNAWNRCMNDMYWAGIYNVHYPGGLAYVDNELWVEDGRHVWGPTEIDGTIKAHTTFLFPSTEVAMIHGRDNGMVCEYATGNGSARVYTHNLKLNGGNTSAGAGSSVDGTPACPGSNGLLTSTQQPSDLESIRIDNCDGYGIAVTGTQQIDGERWQIILCRRALVLRSTAFVRIRGILNIEKSLESCIRTEKISGQLDCYSIEFAQLHIESHGILPSVAHFDLTSMQQVKFGTAYIGVQPGATVFKVAANAGKSAARPASYMWDNLYVGGSPSTATLINDADRGTYSCADLLSGNEVGAMLLIAQPLEAPVAASPDGYPGIMLLGRGGGYVKIGASDATSTYKTPRIVVKTIDANQRVITARDSTDAETWAVRGDGTIDQSGVLHLTGNGAPAVAAPVGSTYRRKDGSANTVFYMKESGTGTSGWVAYGAASGAVANADALSAMHPTVFTRETFPRSSRAVGGGAILTSQTIQVQAIYLESGSVVSNIGFVAGTGGLLAPVNCYFGIYTIGGALLGRSANTTSAWTANTAKVVAIAFDGAGAAASTVTIPSTALYYLALLYHGTVNNIQVGTTANSAAIAALPPILSGKANTGQTTLPTTLGTVTEDTQLVYGGIS